MFDITPFLELKIAPRAVFDALDERRARPRFMLPTPSGDWQRGHLGRLRRRDPQASRARSGRSASPGDRAAIYAPNRWSGSRPRWPSRPRGA
jgi:long-chain acyl-CoA synthetase